MRIILNVILIALAIVIIFYLMVIGFNMKNLNNEVRKVADTVNEINNLCWEE